eukprot:1066378-Amphidinium_carterae.1
MVLTRVEKPSWQVYADAGRLRLALRIVRASCPAFRACMCAASFSSGSWWVALGHSINRMKSKVPALGHLPDFDADNRALWLNIVAFDKPAWKKWIKEYVANDVRDRQLQQPDVDLDVPEAQVQELVDITEYHCELCDRTCKTYRGLLSHRRQSHSIESRLATRVGTNECAECHGQYATRRDHLVHLNKNLRCALYTMVHCPELTEEELRIARTVKNILRTAPPKRGPKKYMAEGCIRYYGWWQATHTFGNLAKATSRATSARRCCTSTTDCICLQGWTSHNMIVSLWNALRLALGATVTCADMAPTVSRLQTCSAAQGKRQADNTAHEFKSNEV